MTTSLFSSPSLLLLFFMAVRVPVLAAGHQLIEDQMAKYNKERQTLEDLRRKQVETFRSAYVTALTAARGEAVRAKKNGSLAAIDTELAAAKSDTQRQAAPPDLPSGLAGARREFLRGFDLVNKDIGARLKQLNLRHLMALDAIARSDEYKKDATLASKVMAERNRITAADAVPAVPALQRNVIENGDFSLMGENGMPKNWQRKGADYQGDNVPWQNDALVMQEGSEQFLRFRRVSPVRLANVGPVARIVVPERAKEASVSVKLRVKGLVPGEKYDRYPGVSIKALDSSGNSPGPVTAAATEDTHWKTFTAKVKLPPDAKALDVSLGPWAATGICDFDDVVVKFEQ